jgi:hypothetical protein
MLFITGLKAILPDQKTLFCHIQEILQLRDEVLHEYGPVEATYGCPK